MKSKVTVSLSTQPLHAAPITLYALPCNALSPTHRKCFVPNAFAHSLRSLAHLHSFGLAGVNIFDIDSATGEITVRIETSNGLPEVALGVAGVNYEWTNGGSVILEAG